MIPAAVAHLFLFIEHLVDLGARQIRGSQQPEIDPNEGGSGFDYLLVCN